MDWKFLIGIFGASGAWLWSVYTWRRSQAAQRTQNEFIRKEALYRDLLRTLVTFYKSGANTGTAPLLEQYRLAWLYAPDAVVNRLRSLLETQKIDPAESHMTEEQKKTIAARRDEQGSRAFAEAVAAMRADLFATSDKSTRLTAADFRHYY
ncbi:MAG: hypothetical protein WAJ87_20755 [Bryobacteraceae bacterium]